MEFSQSGQDVTRPAVVVDDSVVVTALVVEESVVVTAPSALAPVTAPHVTGTVMTGTAFATGRDEKQRTKDTNFRDLSGGEEHGGD